MVLLQWSKDVNQNFYDSLCISFMPGNHITSVFKTGRRREGAGPVRCSLLLGEQNLDQGHFADFCSVSLAGLCHTSMGAGEVNVCFLCQLPV